MGSALLNVQHCLFQELPKQVAEVPRRRTGPGLPYVPTWTLIIFLYKLKRSRGGSRLFGSLFVRGEVCVWVSDPRFIQFALGSYYAVHINELSI